jgi:hypothetical protein
MDQALFNRISLMEEYAGAAYCPGNTNSTITGDKVSCNTGNCPLVEATGAVTVAEFQK